MRAGEAKLCECVREKCLPMSGAVAGKTCSSSRRVCEWLGVWVSTAFHILYWRQAVLLLLIALVLKMWFDDLLVFAWVLRGTTSKPVQIATSEYVSS